MTHARAIPAVDMEQLLESGRARALLDGHFPVPVEIDGQWWHVPADPPANSGIGDFVQAAESLAAEFARLAARRRAAAAVRSLDGRERT